MTEIKDIIEQGNIFAEIALSTHKIYFRQTIGNSFSCSYQLKLSLKCNYTLLWRHEITWKSFRHYDPLQSAFTCSNLTIETLE